MSATPANIQIALSGPTVWLRITGRANHLISADFKRVLERMLAAGRRSYAFDLTQCMLLDSTFLGLMAGLAQDLAEDPSLPAEIRLLNANERITDFLDNLGVLNLFTLVKSTEANPTGYETVAPSTPDKVELSRTSLEAHQRLMAVNPANIPKFKDVIVYLQEELRRGGSTPP